MTLNASGGNAITGNSTAANGFGLVGTGSGATGGGVAGVSSATGGGYGVYGQAAGTTNASAGVMGINTFNAGSGQTSLGVVGVAGTSSWTYYTGGPFGVYGYTVGSSGGSAGVMGVDSFAAGTGQSSIGVLGTAGGTSFTYFTGGAMGVLGSVSRSNDWGVYGYNGATSDGGFGTGGRTASAHNASGGIAAGLYGWGSNTTAGTYAYGVFGVASTTSYSYFGNASAGVMGSATRDTDSGVIGLNTAATGGEGVYGQSTATAGGGTGVFGVNATAAGTGQSAIGVYGLAGTSGWSYFTGIATGLVGFTNRANDISVLGWTNTVGGYAVYGRAASSTANWAAYFWGNVNVTGTLTKGGGAFKIDHPTDPANKYLYHSFVESPDMKNIYDGVVTLGADGTAWVTLPDWFEALNQDFRYQLTCIGGYAPVYVSRKIEGNRFQIAGGTPGLEVSWQVTGIRHDPWAEAHRIPVEQWKTGTERGKYLYPDLYGQPASRGIDYRPAVSVPAGNLPTVVKAAAPVLEGQEVAP